MREIFTSGSVGRALGNRCLYPEPDPKNLAAFSLGDAGRYPQERMM